MMTEHSSENLAELLRRRVARLLLLHNRRVFHGHFREWYRSSTLHDMLQAHDDFTRLVLLSEELLDTVLPRIHRQMSFQATRTVQHEESQPRGQIEWNATLNRSLREHPGEVPFYFTTSQRNRSAATPENRLLLAVLEHLTRRLAAARTRHAPGELSDSEQQELAQLADRVRRERAALHLDDHAEHDSDSDDITSLAAAVEHDLPPGGANPYRDLVDWWRRFERLRLHTRRDERSSEVLDSAATLDALYQLWLTLELLELLAQRQALNPADLRADPPALMFRWQGRQFTFAAAHPLAAPGAWEGISGSPVGALFRRAAPLEVVYQGQHIWQEPGVVLHACCTAPEPLRRVLADLRLGEAAQAVLVLPELQQIAPLVRPSGERYQGTAAETEIRCYALRPHEPPEPLHTQLAALLDQVAAWLPERPPIACHGMLQDSDSVNPGGMPPQRSEQTGALLALCPKPHIGPGHVNLVDPQADCLRDPRVCHILGQPHAAALVPPFVKRVLNKEQLAENIAQLRERLSRQIDPDDESEAAESARTALLHTIGELTESYVNWRQPDTLLAQIEEKLAWAFGELWRADQHQRGLPEDVRNMLISGEYVWNEFQQSKMKDWAACAVQYVRALERELHRRLYERCGSPSALRYYEKAMIPHQFTFGSVSRAYRKRLDAEPDPNWQTLVTWAALPSGADPQAFEAIVGEIARLRTSRNKIAHSQRIDKALAGSARSAVLGQPNQPGVLRRFIAMLDAA